MGRIEDALRRAGVGDAAATPPEVPTGAVATPWSLSEEPAPVPPEDRIEPGVYVPRLLEEKTPPLAQAFSKRWADRLVVSERANPVLIEQFRSLGAALHRLQSNGTLKVLMVTSAEPGEGKTLTAVNLALTLSESYRRRVLLVDADLRRPSIRELAQMSELPGLSEGLKEQTDQKLTVLRITDTLTLLPAGRPDSDPLSGLTSPRMQRIIEEAAARFDWVILDAPPVDPVADARLLSAMMDGILLVVRAGLTPCGAVQRAIEGVGRDRILGVVLNGVDETDRTGYAHYYGQINPGSPTT